MILDKLTTFTDGITSTTSAQYSDVLDFYKHGDDILNRLFWNVYCQVAAAYSTLTVTWQTSTDEAFTSPTDLYAKTIATTDLTVGNYPLRNEALPKGLKQYNRLKIQATSTAGEGQTAVYAKIASFLVDGRVEGTPFKGNA